jgi:hypothetical protein
LAHHVGRYAGVNGFRGRSRLFDGLREIMPRFGGMIKSFAFGN